MTPDHSKHGRRLTFLQRSHCQDLAHAEHHGHARLSVTRLARMLGCSRSAVYRWMHRDDVFPRRPGPVPGQLKRPLPERMHQDADTWRANGYTVDQVHGALQDEYPTMPITRHQVRTFAHQQGWAPLMPKAVPRETQPFADQPMGFLHVDLIIGPDLGRGTVILTIRERHSRWADAMPVPSKKSADVAAGLHQLLARCPVEIHVVLTDCGSEFCAEFDAYLMTLGIEHRRTKPRTPQTNGMVERFNGLLKHLGPVSHPAWWAYQDGERPIERDLWARRREPERVFPDKRVPRMTHELTRWCAWRNMVQPNTQLGRISPLAWCVKHPTHCVPHILQAIIQAWAAHPELVVTNGHRWAHSPPAK